MPDSDITLGEVHRRLIAMDVSNNARFGQIERRMEAGFSAMNNTIASQGYVHVDRYVADQRAIERRMEDYESNQKWTQRAIYGAVSSIIVGVLVAVMVAYFNAGGRP